MEPEPAPVPDEDTIQEELTVSAQTLCDTIKHRSSKETGLFLNTLPDYILKGLFPTAANYQTEDEHDVRNQDDIPDIVKEFLPLACEKGDVNVVLMLLNFGADPKLKGNKGSPLSICTLHNHQEIITRLTSWDPGLLADPSEVTSCLVNACEGGHDQSVTFWLDRLRIIHGRELMAGDFEPETDPVDAACKGGHAAIAGSLLQDGISAVTRQLARCYPEVLAEVFNTWVEDADQSQQQENKLCARWTKKNLHVFEHSWLRIPRCTGALSSIDLSHNSLVTVPGMLLWELPWLEKLMITHNALSKIPAPVSVDQLEILSLKSLYLSNNHLKTVPSEIFMLQHLEYLNLSDNKLESINPAHVNILHMPDQDQERLTWKCCSLKRLILSNNKLLRIPSDIKVTRQLKKLDVSHNRLKEVPAPWDCPLEELYLQHNNINDVPDMHACWNKTLKYLNLSRNNLSEIPWTICRLQSLLDLKLANNGIWRLPAINEWGIHNLQMLDLSGNMLVHHDPSQSRPLSTVSSTSQSSLGDSISYLMANEGRLPAPPAAGGGSRTPTPTEEMPPRSSNSNFFFSLDPDSDLQHTNILMFPSSFHNSLRSLDLSCNQLQAIPDCVCEMKPLQSLDLHGNEGLTHLPEKLALLSQLYNLILDKNQIKHPHEVAAIMAENERATAKIMKLLLEKHHRSQPYRGLKLMIVGPEKCGKTSLLCCLTGLDWPDNDKGVNVQDWRLSKTELTESRASSLGRRLFKKTAQDEDEITFSMWDLKGGDNYSVIHQTLFTPHTLYLLVWDVRDKEAGIQKLRPWILNIQAQAPESTIIAVGTHFDKLPSAYEKRRQIIESLHETFRYEFPRLPESNIIQKSFVEVNATSPTATGIRELKEAIYNCASSMKYSASNRRMDDYLVGRKVPHSFLILQDLVKQEVKQRQSVFPPKPPIMTEDTLTNHVRAISECHMNTPKDLEEAVAFLRDTGSIVHVSDHTYGLTNLFFLDPSWLCSVLLAVVKLKDSTTDGMVTKTMLQDLCEQSGFGKDRFDEYIQLLARFEIALPASLKRFLIPSLLPKVPPVMEHTRFSKFKGKLERWYKMAYIPPGFWSRLVSRMMVNIRQMDQKQGERKAAASIRKPSHGSLHLRQTHTTVWQEGIFVSFDAGQMKVEPMQFPDNRPGVRVTVRCQQQVFRPMGFVVDHIETLLSEWYPGLDDESQDTEEPLIQRLVPCPKCDEFIVENEDPYSLEPTSMFDNIHTFKLKHLVVLATLKAQEHVQCPLHPSTLLPLKQLLPDVFMVDLNVSYLMDNKLDIQRRLGIGGFGEVFKATYNGKAVAVKQLLKRQVDSLPKCLLPNQPYYEEEQEVSVIYKFPQLRSEVAMMSRLKHPCIIKLFGVSIQQLSFAMEFAPLGDLDSYISKRFEETKSQLVSERTVHRTILPRMLTYKITHQVATAIQYLHRMRIIHTDLKTDNVLLCSDDPASHINIKLADYGISHVMFGGGVKGAAGFHAFCAPEILRGKAFDENVDWFSYGMLIYHIMSGLLPFHDLQSSIEAKAVVTSGNRPKLSYPDYTLEPRFAHLEGMMNWCWMDSPADRPDKEEVLYSMRDASFLCLRHKIDLESEPKNCLYCSADSQSEMDALRQYRMWLWKGKGESRNYTKFNVEHSAQMRPKECPGKTITCALLYGEFHFLGTEPCGIEVHGVQGTGRQRFSHLQSLSTTNRVTALYYLPVDPKVANSRKFGHLFAGLQDGTVAIFAHTKPPPDRPQKTHLIQLKTLTLSTNAKPCLCMHLIADKMQLWISCGNTLRVLCIQDMLLDPTAVTVAPDEQSHVKGLVSWGDYVWCFINGSSQVIQYSQKTWIWVDTLQCGGVTPSKGECLSNPVSAKHPLAKKVSFEGCGGNAEAGGTSGTEEADLEGLEEDHYDEPEESPAEEEEEEGLAFHEDHFEKPVVKEISLLKNRKRNTMPSGGISRKDRSAGRRRTRPYSDSTLRHTGSTMFAKVTAILVVKDTLWIGRDTGDIIVANVDKESPYDYRFGEVIALLSVQSYLKWSHGGIRQLLPVGSDRVVACRDVASSDARLKHQLLVWENWGCKEVNDFEEVHFALEKARKGQQ